MPRGRSPHAAPLPLHGLGHPGRGGAGRRRGARAPRGGAAWGAVASQRRARGRRPPRLRKRAGRPGARRLLRARVTPPGKPSSAAPRHRPAPLRAVRPRARGQGGMRAIRPDPRFPDAGPWGEAGGPRAEAERRSPRPALAQGGARVSRGRRPRTAASPLITRRRRCRAGGRRAPTGASYRAGPAAARAAH